MRRFGSDKPDLRYGLELSDFSEALRDTEFSVFRQVLSGGGIVRGICVPGGAAFSRKQTDDLTTFVQQFGAKGLVSIAFLGEGSIDSLAEEDIRSPVAKYFTVEQAKEMARIAGAKRGDMLLLVADKTEQSPTAPSTACAASWRSASSCTTRTCSPSPSSRSTRCSSGATQRSAGRRPTTRSRRRTSKTCEFLDSDPGRVRSHAYDLVCNGWELFSGSIRIHQREVQEKMFSALGISPEEAKRKFGHMLEAFEYGAPPHAGIGAGIDRVTGGPPRPAGHPRGDRLSQDEERLRTAHRRPNHRLRATAAGAAHRGDGNGGGDGLSHQLLAPYSGLL